MLAHTTYVLDGFSLNHKFCFFKQNISSAPEGIITLIWVPFYLKGITRVKICFTSREQLIIRSIFILASTTPVNWRFEKETHAERKLEFLGAEKFGTLDKIWSTLKSTFHLRSLLSLYIYIPFRIFLFFILFSLDFLLWFCLFLKSCYNKVQNLNYWTAAVYSHSRRDHSNFISAARQGD